MKIFFTRFVHLKLRGFFEIHRLLATGRPRIPPWPTRMPVRIPLLCIERAQPD
jgi:hypothetical protein